MGHRRVAVQNGAHRKVCPEHAEVAAHTNVYYNELADRTAKAGLRQGEGIPKVRSLVGESGPGDGIRT